MLDLLLATLRSLRAHALRFSLTSLGILWGSFMLTYLSASIGGLNQHFVRELEEVGPKIVFMGPGMILKNRVGERGARSVELEGEDLDRLESLDSIDYATPRVELWSQIVRAGRRTKLLNVQGVNAAAEQVRSFGVAQGRFLSPLDVARSARVAFLGERAAVRLFSSQPPLGQRIQIASVAFRVVGVAVGKGDQLVNAGDLDDLAVLIPYTTAQRWFTRSDALPEINFAPKTREASWDAIRHARQVLGLHHDFHPDVETALWSFNLYEMLFVVFRMMGALRIFLVAAGVITLLVGAVGVMNIMLVIVGERTAEIGLRKAVGAPGRAIFAQFVAEAAAVCGFAGLFGAALGIALTQIVARVVPPDAPLASVPILDPFTVAVIVVSLFAAGVVAGVVPAMRAARIPPAEALRSL